MSGEKKHQSEKLFVLNHVSQLWHKLHFIYWLLVSLVAKIQCVIKNSRFFIKFPHYSQFSQVGWMDGRVDRRTQD